MIGDEVKLMDRNNSLSRIADRKEAWDMIVIGGGATGIGIAMDAASRGFSCLLLEKSDFGKGTSSRSTKLIHGGVRYLQQGNITLVRDALRERALLKKNAAHLVSSLAFIIPCTSKWQQLYYAVGLKAYDALSSKNSFERSESLGNSRAQSLLPSVLKSQLKYGVQYYDGQFDDARLLINMAQTACSHDACLVNYAPVRALLKNQQGKVCGVKFHDEEGGVDYEASAKIVINATGPFTDSVRRMDDANIASMVAASQGIHIVLPRTFFPSDVAMIIPKTSDGRVLFVIPWYDHVLVGTTDTPLQEVALEPLARQEEIDFLLDTVAQYLTKTPTRDDILSVFTGIRPLVRGDKSARTASLSRDHTIVASPSGLVTIAGGKWTTVRKMSEDCVDFAIKANDLAWRPCRTMSLSIHGCPSGHGHEAETAKRSYYGTDLARIRVLEQNDPLLAERLHPDSVLYASDVVWSVRHEMARTVEDVMARRNRALFLNARAAVEAAPKVAALMAVELQKGEGWITQQLEHFRRTAMSYLSRKN